jgi:hypothetical protein
MIGWGRCVDCGPTPLTRAGACSLCGGDSILPRRRFERPEVQPELTLLALNVETTPDELVV